MTDSTQTELQLVLVVANTQSLSPGLSASHVFTTDGGTIGSSSSADWILDNRTSDVAPYHAELVHIDHEMCLIDLHNACFINGSTIPVGLGKAVALKDKDVIQIGGYQIRASLKTTSGFDAWSEGSLGSVFGLDDDIFAEENNELAEKADSNLEAAIDDPLEALEALAQASLQEADLAAELIEDADRSTASRVSYNLTDNPSYDSDAGFYEDMGSELSSAVTTTQYTPKERELMDFKSIERLERDVENDLLDKKPSDGFTRQDYLSADPHREGYPVSGVSNHVISGPLMRGLETAVGQTDDMAEMQALSEEIGASMKSAIDGLLNLHHQVAQSRYGVMNKNFQPIEDNPLRLGLSYEETMKIMFDGKRSAVHLSAPSAISESLANIRYHNDAVQAATTEALAQVLMAFSPAVLMRRFKAYSRVENPTNEQASAWAWEMYNSYYNELISPRQRGFEKLFWEIFDQAYDRNLRDKLREAQECSV
ncbi:type VI secretion system-associated FHA domain protein TagH [Enterovibrio sp. ZSDZ35]|uniref:Type VI secretion system-associated FHA domain protein TagH n=1 Tax=Enterovibrio qingdaonensis TaxID=2899818 RepID=A0ABT5QHN9_9GAMM|nr:type VI secretion system-associated FHA domain protein TagH [Enterovibrio sp. ZSDZ35]MDD1780506.1 type VI secretion system-associated FHA domain protein TagH [Enterovibrio sp. ZSDZ35]